MTTFNKFCKGRLDNEHHYLENAFNIVVISRIDCLVNDEIMLRQMRLDFYYDFLYVYIKEGHDTTITIEAIITFLSY